MSNNRKWMIFDFALATVDAGCGVYNLTHGSVGEGVLLFVLAGMLVGCGFMYKGRDL